MKAKALSLMLPIALVASGIPAAMAQVGSSPPVGSLVKRKPKAADAARTGAAVKAFAQCTYRRKPAMVAKLLRYSDPATVDMVRAEVDKIYSDKSTGVRDCVGSMADVADTGVELRIAPGRLRILMMEEDYLAHNAKTPTLDSLATPPMRQFVALDAELVSAQAIARFADCVVAKEPALADALVRTAPASDDERSAARALTPALGGCLLQGEQMKLNAASVRVYAVEGLWARFARREDNLAGGGAVIEILMLLLTPAGYEDKQATLADFADCAIVQARDKTAAFLATQPATREEGLALRKFGSMESCTRGRSFVSARTGEIRGALAEAALKRDAAKLAALIARAATAPARITERAAGTRPFVIAYGQCIAAAAPAEAVSLIVTPHGSDDEKRAFVAIGEPLKGCMPEGVAYAINIRDVRNHVADALYRLSEKPSA